MKKKKKTRRTVLQENFMQEDILIELILKDNFDGFKQNNAQQMFSH